MRRRFTKRPQRSNEDNELSAVLKAVDGMPTDDAQLKRFSDFPLSSRTQKGLKKHGYGFPTDIQRATLRLALQGKDVLGAAKTGSGKTLAFLIPVLEKLWRERWSKADGLGALIISPTRELAYQTFQVLMQVGNFHDNMNAGLVTGGKGYEAERDRIASTNIVVCTPGRLLQHMDETPDFRCDSLQALVLDEADRILDMGFATTLNAIIENLPSERQTMLFSATQTKSVRSLARLSLKEPEYVAVDEEARYSTPDKLTQNYIEVNVEDKLQVLYSFIRSNTRTKGIIFVSTCKQVRYAYECFRRMRPGIPLLLLYGKLKQQKRTGIYNNFRQKEHAFLIATDIAARGLDFPAVQWVIQMDCPEDVDMYIHRVGRTARYQKGGQSLLMLTPSEKDAMLKALDTRKVPINEVRPDPRKVQPLTANLAQFCTTSEDMNNWAKKTFVSYVRSVYLQSNKEVFDVSQIPLETYASSLGLSTVPKVRFLAKAKKLRLNSAPPSKVSGDSDDDEGLGTTSDDEEEEENDEEDDRTADDDSVSNEGSDGDSDDGSDDDDDDDDDDEVLKPKKGKVHHLNKKLLAAVEEEERKREAEATKRKQKSRTQTARALTRKKVKINSHVVFDEEGEVESSETTAVPTAPGTTDLSHLQPVNLDGGEDGVVAGGLNLAAANREMRAADRRDLQSHRQRIKDMHKEKRRKIKEQTHGQEEEDGEGMHVQLSAAMPESDGDGASSAEEPVQPAKKRRRSATKEKRQQQHSARDSDEFDTGASVRDDEALALHLLSQK